MKQSQHADAAERLRSNLKAAMQCLRMRESGTIVKHIVHDVAHLVSVFGERRLRDLYEDILRLAEGIETCEPCETSHFEDSGCESTRETLTQGVHHTADSTEYESDCERIHEANRDLLDKISTMRSAVRHMELRRKDEVHAVTVQLEKYKSLLSDTEKKLMAERIMNRKLRNQIDRLSWHPTPRQSTERSPRSISCHTNGSSGEYDHGPFGFGALTVRGCQSRRNCTCNTQVSTSRPFLRPISAKSRKHRREHDPL